MLEQELAFFQSQVGEWVQHHAGKIALVRGEQLIGMFPTDDEALAEGARRFGLSSFLVRRVSLEEAAVSIPALTLGLLGAPA